MVLLLEVEIKIVLAAVCKHMNVSVDTPWQDLPKRAKDALLYGIEDEELRVDYITVEGRRLGRMRSY